MLLFVLFLLFLFFLALPIALLQILLELLHFLLKLIQSEVGVFGGTAAAPDGRGFDLAPVEFQSGAPLSVGSAAGFVGIVLAGLLVVRILGHNAVPLGGRPPV